MGRPANPKMPMIAVEDDTVALRLGIPSSLNATIELYGHYYAEKTGHKPLGAPHVVVGVLGQYFSTDAGFQKWKRDNSANEHLKKSPFAAIKPPPKD
jgi:hypothetical protein